MKQITLLSIFIFVFSIVGVAQNTAIDEKFETGLPSTAPSVETSYTLSSGTWKVKGVYAKTDNGSTRATMSANGYLITPPIDKPTQLSFVHRGSGNGKVLNVEKSIDNGLTWKSIGSATVSSSSSYGSSSLSVGEPGTKNVLVRFTCTSATIYLDNILISSSNIGDEPSQQATLSASEITGTSMKISFTKGNGENRLLAYSKGEATTWLPEDGTAYKNLPKQVDDNVIVVYAGNEDNFVVNGLEAGETYHFVVFEFNGTKDACNYLTTSVGRLEQRTAEVPSISLKPTAIKFGDIKTGTTAKRSFSFSAKYLNSTDGVITLTSSPDFLISTQSATGFENSLNISYSESKVGAQTIYVQFAPSELKDYTLSLTLAGGGASSELTLSGTGSDTDAKTYYIAPNGDDENEGTYDSPWYNLQKAVDAAVAGDFIVCRGGTYYPNMKKDGSKTTIRLNHSGEAGKRITIMAYPDETPILNFKDQPKKVSVRGIQLDGNYWHIYGLHITEAGDNGIKLEGNHNIIERCTLYKNDDTGIQLGFGHKFSDTHPGIGDNDGSYCSYNYIIDCDSYLNCDSDNFGSDADGFACKMHNGRENWFIRCRAWDNSDDAWDLYETDYPVYLIDCWAWGSGRASLFDWVDASGSFQGNGNGIKLGGNGTGGSSKGKHEVWNSVAFNCNKSGSVKGFDQNSHGGGVKVVNCLGFGNGYDFMFEKSSNQCEYYNNVCLGNIEIHAGAADENNAMLSTSSKAWLNVVERNFSTADYVSLEEADAKAPRGEDGSFPEKFARLREGSNLIGKAKVGLIAPLPQEIGEKDVFGSALKPRTASRDLGPIDCSSDIVGIDKVPSIEAGMSIYPNPAQNHALIRFSTTQDSSQANLTLFDIQGRKIRNLASLPVAAGEEYKLPVDLGNLLPGIYWISLTTEKEQLRAKFIITK
ncbi:T9SS C-terminal target domain-containing protein [Bacteroides sp. 214]|uniref:T9SS type A sorting domain-containing protein n=1 Tax=Bacteroides sp. 214 TaxID=2302935 RepID=UPI0013D8B9CC|nr:T9SS type A sorting domain-containing protein [Bacteroides sp. 214]NDW11435.1 T9SS C-terminal target domain-containing protein [Bacteroides sp. 214]